jgi:hypothetical protein
MKLLAKLATSGLQARRGGYLTDHKVYAFKAYRSLDKSNTHSELFGFRVCREAR